MSEAEAAEDQWAFLEFDQADRLRRSLRVSKVSVQAMADELDVVRDTVGNYINGHTKPNKSTLVVWGMKTGFPVEWLENGVMPSTSSPHSSPLTGRYPVSAPGSVTVLRLLDGPRVSAPAVPVRPSPVTDLAAYAAGRRAGSRRNLTGRSA